MAAGGKLRGPENLYENVTKITIASIDNSFPASKGEVRASTSELSSRLEAGDSKLEAELEKYKNKTTAIIDGLVSKVNALTPVGHWSHKLSLV